MKWKKNTRLKLIVIITMMLFLKKRLLAVKVKKNNRQNIKNDEADNVQKEPARKQKFKNLDLLMNENSYLGIPVQPKIVFRYQDAKKLWRSNSTPTRTTPSCNKVEPKTYWNILQDHVDLQSESRHHSSRLIFSFLRKWLIALSSMLIRT